MRTGSRLTKTRLLAAGAMEVGRRHLPRPTSGGPYRNVVYRYDDKRSSASGSKEGRGPGTEAKRVWSLCGNWGGGKWRESLAPR